MDENGVSNLIKQLLGLLWIVGFSEDFHGNTVHKGNFPIPSFG
jgi:hypothetical protein